MFSKEITEQTLKGIVWLNDKMGIWSFIIPLIFATLALFFLFKAYKNPSRRNSTWVLLTYSLIYIYGSWTIFIGKGFMGSGVAISGASALSFVAILLILDIVFGWTEVKLSDNLFLRSTSLSLVLGGIFLYPILELLLGFKFPRMVFFGAECPTTISLIGIFIGSIPRVNKLLFVIISLNAIVTGLSFAVAGAPFDYFYVLAGLLATIAMILFFKEIFLTKRANI